MELQPSNDMHKSLYCLELKITYKPETPTGLDESGCETSCRATLEVTRLMIQGIAGERYFPPLEVARAHLSFLRTTSRPTFAFLFVRTLGALRWLWRWHALALWRSWRHAFWRRHTLGWWRHTLGWRRHTLWWRRHTLAAFALAFLWWWSGRVAHTIV